MDLIGADGEKNIELKNQYNRKMLEWMQMIRNYNCKKKLEKTWTFWSFLNDVCKDKFFNPVKDTLNAAVGHFIKKRVFIICYYLLLSVFIC